MTQYKTLLYPWQALWSACTASGAEGRGGGLPQQHPDVSLTLLYVLCWKV
jgi:hypothetical protein